jgi:glutamate N-acetyltransferase / amino-acid N-acetyltransferase
VALNWPRGFQSAGAACGIKTAGALDLGVLVCEGSAAWAGTFTRNAAAAACVGWCSSRLGSQVRAIVVNSGNANACTGTAGERAVREVAAAAAASLGCAPDDVLVSSTGPIGVPLPYERITGMLPSLETTPSVGDFSRAIMTTDTHPKVARAAAGDAEVVGVAKGAAMLAPNMATMLAFITTDAHVAQPELRAMLSHAVDLSFNRLCIDACESTNDSVFLLSSGLVDADAAALASAVESVCRDLALQMAHDAEGGTKVVTIAVEGAADDVAATELGKAVASSILWRAAVNGGDPNWGRVLSALGSVDRSLSLDAVELCIGNVVVFSKGEPLDAFTTAAREMAGTEFRVSCRVGDGPGSSEVVTTDLSTEYVVLNSVGTS